MCGNNNNEHDGFADETAVFKAASVSESRSSSRSEDADDLVVVRDKKEAVMNLKLRIYNLYLGFTIIDPIEEDLDNDIHKDPNWLPRAPDRSLDDFRKNFKNILADRYANSPDLYKNIGNYSVPLKNCQKPVYK